jgi:hypothetical protein
MGLIQVSFCGTRIKSTVRRTLLLKSNLRYFKLNFNEEKTTGAACLEGSAVVSTFQVETT